MKKIIFTLLCVICISSNSHGTVLNSSTFDLSSESWSTQGLVSSNGFSASDGNPGGYYFGRSLGVGAANFIDVPFYFAAPTDYLSLLSMAYGGALSYDIKSFNGYLSVFLGGHPDIIVSGSGLSLGYTANESVTNHDWLSVKAQLIASDNWLLIGTNIHPTEEQLLTTLSSANAFLIRGSYSVYGNELMGIDNVILESANIPVPEPSTFLLLGAGFGCFICLSRRVKK